MRKFIFKRILSFVLIFMFAVLNAGCWGAKFIEMPQRSIDVSTAVDTVLVREKNLEERLESLQKQLDMQQEYSRRTAAGTKMDIEGLKDQLNAMRQLMLDSSMSGSSQGVKVVPELSDEPRRLPRPAEEDSQDSLKTNLEGESLTAESDSIRGPGAEIKSPADSASVETPGNIPAADVIFRQIYLDFSRMEYQIALDDSKLFLEEYPEDPLAQEVIFIRGECLIEQNKYFDALKEFSQILKEYPNGKKVPAALLRMAVAYEKIGDSDLAAGIIRRLVRDYPYSEETAVAKEKFGEMLEN